MLTLYCTLFTLKWQEVAGSILGLCQYFFKGLMIVIATGFIPLSLLSIISIMITWENSQLIWKEYCVEYWLKELQESMDRWTGCCNMTEILLKTALHTKLSINKLIILIWTPCLTQCDVTGDNSLKHGCFPN